MTPRTAKPKRQRAKRKPRVLGPTPHDQRSPRDYLTPRQVAADYPGVFAVGTLASWRQRNMGPPYSRLAGSDQIRALVVYVRGELEQWIEQHRIQPGAAA